MKLNADAGQLFSDNVGRQRPLCFETGGSPVLSDIHDPESGLMREQAAVINSAQT